MITYLLQLINIFLSARRLNQDHSQIESNAFSAIKDAIRCTKVHIQKHPSEEFVDYEFSDIDSSELSSKWSEAARLIRPIDNKLASILEEKSDYWIDPKKFRREIQDGYRRANMRIRLEEVEKELYKLEN